MAIAVFQERTVVKGKRRTRPARRGENHYRATLTDREVQLVEEMFAEGLYSYKTLGEIFEVPRLYIRDIVKGRRR